MLQLPEFSVPASLSISLSLSTLCEHLSANHQVEGILVMGSEARQSLRPESDYDLLIIVRDKPEALHVLLTNVEGRLTDVIFGDLARVETLQTQQLIKNNDPKAVLLHWLMEGRIAYDAHGNLSALQAQPPAINAQTDTGRLFDLWYRVNFNLIHGERMLKSDDGI